MARLAAIVMFCTLAVASTTARPATLVADLSHHLIAITTAFSGAEVLLFGNVEDADDVIVHVRGPSADAVVRRKEPVMGLWLNRQRVRLDDVPSFYALASTGNLDSLLPVALRERYGIGVESLGLQAAASADDAEQQRAFVDGFIRTRQNEGLYVTLPSGVQFLGPTLFRTTIPFPANSPPGRYHVEVFGVSDGQIIAAQQNTLQITKVGLEAELTDFAHEQASLYALGAIVIATFLGWLAAVVLRRA